MDGGDDRVDARHRDAERRGEPGLESGQVDPGLHVHVREETVQLPAQARDGKRKDGQQGDDGQDSFHRISSWVMSGRAERRRCVEYT